MTDKDVAALTPDQEYLQTIQSHRIKQDSLVFRQIYGDLDVSTSKNVNPYLAASVTGWARVLLHQKIRETTAAYCDTDSVIYLHKPGRVHLHIAFRLCMQEQARHPECVFILSLLHPW
jgi:hypothetical protein